MPTTKKNGQNRKPKNDKASSEDSNTLKAFKDWLKVCEATRKRLEREA